MGVKKADPAKLARTIFGAHKMIAVGLKAPMLAISAEEAAVLAEACADVSAEFDVPINTKWLAVGNLLGALASIHGPRLFMMVAMKKPKPAPAARPVVQQDTQGVMAASAALNTATASADAGVTVAAPAGVSAPRADGGLQTGPMKFG